MEMQGSFNFNEGVLAEALRQQVTAKIERRPETPPCFTVIFKCFGNRLRAANSHYQIPTFR